MSLRADGTHFLSVFPYSPHSVPSANDVHWVAYYVEESLLNINYYTVSLLIAFFAHLM